MNMWQHLKTGNTYRLLKVAKDCTNERNGGEVAVYQNTEEGSRMVFVRDLAEFREKFAPVDPEALASMEAMRKVWE